MSDAPTFIKRLREADEEFGSRYQELFTKAGEGGALPKKIKTLMVLAMDAANEHPGGVRTLADLAREQGATEEEITETVELVAITCGTQGLAVASNAFEDFEFEL